MAWFWFTAFLLMLAWNATLMRVNSIAMHDVRRLQRHALAARIPTQRPGGDS